MDWSSRYWQIITGESRRWIVLGLAITLGLAACGDPEVSVQEQDYDEAAVQQDIQAWWDSQDIIVVPWTVVLDDSVVETATIEEERLIFAAGISDDVDRLQEWEIVVSGHEELPFLRRILEIERENGQIILHTRNAGLEEAIVEGSMRFDIGDEEEYDDLESQPGQLQQGLSVRHRYRQTFTRNFEHGPAKGKFEFRVDAGAGVDIDIASNFWSQTFGTSRAVGTRSCSSNSQCIQSEECYQGRCTFSGRWLVFNRTRCQDVIYAMEMGQSIAGCSARWERWWDGGSSSDRTCIDPDAGWLSSGKIDAPHPAQIEWARMNCTGTVERFQTEFDTSSTAGVYDLRLEGSISGETGRSFEQAWAGKTFVFLAGKIPVVIRLQPSVEIRLDLSGQGTVTWGATDPMEVTAAFQTGLLYTNANGWAPFNQPGINFTTRGFGGGADATFLSATVEGSLDLTVAPRLTAIFYEIGGPYIEPFSPKAGVDLHVQASTNPSAQCFLGARLGLEGRIGLSAGIPFTGVSSIASHPLYDTCGGLENMDYCSASSGSWSFPCTTRCIYGCGNMPRNRLTLKTPDGGENPYGINDPDGFTVDSIYVERQIGSNLDPEIYLVEELINIDGFQSLDQDKRLRLDNATMSVCGPPDDWEEHTISFTEEMTVAFEEDFEFREFDTIVIRRPTFHPADLCEDPDCEYVGQACQPSGTADVYVATEADEWQVFSGLHGSNYPITIEAGAFD